MVRYKYLIAAGFVIFLAVLVSASFQTGSPDSFITSTYGPSGTIKGWINLSFNDQSGNSLIEDNFENSIRLIDLLKKRSYDYDCDPVNCLSDYLASNGAQSKTFGLNFENSVVYGLRLTGNVVAVNNVSFNFQSDAPTSCGSQIKIDVLDDGTTEFINNKIASGPGCTNLKTYGCYETGQTTEEHVIGNVPYCQRIKLSESPGFNVGAEIKKEGQRTIVASLKDELGEERGSCVLPDASTSGGEVSCAINYSVTTPKDYYICVYAQQSSGTGEYKLKGYSKADGCGFYQTGGIPPTSTTAAYQIFAEGKKFDTIGTLNVINKLSDGQRINDMINTYVFQKYGSYDCTGEGCIIPIKFTSGVNQQITINNLNMRYEKDSGIVTETNFYDLSETPTTVSSNYQRIYLDEVGFEVPSEFGDYDYSLTLDGIEILSEEIDVENIPQVLSLKPTSTASAFPTSFTVNVSAGLNVSSYQWDFGDEGTSVTTTNTVTHTYPSIGSYLLTITLVDNAGFSSSKTFNITVNSPRDLINETISEMKSNIVKIKGEILGFDTFTRSSLNKVLNINTSESEIERLETAFLGATSETEYNQIITDLLKLSVPKTITESAVAKSVTFIPERKNIKPSILQAFSTGYDSDLDDSYRESILSWQQQNLNAKFTFREFSGEYDQATLQILRTFEFDISERKDIGYSYYLVLPNLRNLEFEGITTKTEGDYVYADISGKRKVSFSTTEDVDFTNLPVFITPGVESLSVLDPSPETPPNNTFLILAIIFLMILALAVYLALQQWYKKKYESHLFSNRNDLYNMVNYVNNAKKKGLDKGEIANNLRKSGWSSEQVRYVVRKYGGKVTGMFELPVKNILKKVDEKDERK
jgi:hypothetical protein